MANLITAYLLICQPKSIWESLLVFTILIFFVNAAKTLNPDNDNLYYNRIKSRYYSPHGFNKFKTELPRRASDSCFSVLHNNVRSLRRNLENFQVHLLDELNCDFSIIGVSETKIISEKAWILIQTYLDIFLNALRHLSPLEVLACTLMNLWSIQLLKKHQMRLSRRYGLKSIPHKNVTSFVVLYIDSIILRNASKNILTKLLRN